MERTNISEVILWTMQHDEWDQVAELIRVSTNQRYESHARLPMFVHRSAAKDALKSLLEAVERVDGRITREPEYEAALAVLE